MHNIVEQVTNNILIRSDNSRAAYLDKINQQKSQQRHRSQLGCGNIAHGMAACSPQEKADLSGDDKVNIAIVTAYNDMLSAHQPYQHTPEVLKQAVAKAGGVAEVAGGVPAMCDGITQGYPGMELSLFSRDTIAMSTALALSHNMFDGALLLGVCDKIVPGLLIGALSFGHLPMAFVPAGPMLSGLENTEKARIRGLYAQGKVTREQLLEAESAAYHSAGTCTFYGTANSNQLLMEVMGLQLPGSSFVNPNTPLRHALDQSVAQELTELAISKKNIIGELVNAHSLVNAMVALLASGGSTNHSIHLVAIAKAAGITITWDDFSQLSEVVPSLTRIYPNGEADINHFHAAGGTGVFIQLLLQAGLLHGQCLTVFDQHSVADYSIEPSLEEGCLGWHPSPTESLDSSVIAKPNSPFATTGGLKLLSGNLGRAMIKVSAVEESRYITQAPAKVFNSQEAFLSAFKAGQLEQNFIAVLRYQGPKSNGMPELHKLMPALGVLMDKGFQVALVTDGRLSGASGKVPAAIHVCPEAAEGGLISKINDGDVIRVDACAGQIELLVDQQLLANRIASAPDLNQQGCGRELFSMFRNNVSSAELGASCFD